MASAETGSGKTAAFALPICQLCFEQKTHPSSLKHSRNGVPPETSATQEIMFRMSAQDRDATISFDPASNGLRLQSRAETKWAGCRCSSGISLKQQHAKHYYFECIVLDDVGIVRVGWSSLDASLELGTDAFGYGYGGTGTKVNKSKYEKYPNTDDSVSFGKGDVIGCHLQIKCVEQLPGSDWIAELSYSKNGNGLGVAFEIKLPFGNEENVGLIPAVCLKYAGCELNFGGDTSKPFIFPPTSPFLPVANANRFDLGGLFNPRDSSVVSAPQPTATTTKTKINSQMLPGPLAIVIEPTRDLAEQTFQVFDDLCQRVPAPLTAALLIGGVGNNETISKLDRNQVDILVGTPPIVAAYMKKGTISALRCKFFVLDEADELITKDSLAHIETIFGRLAAANDAHRSGYDRLQVCFFSATLRSPPVRDLASKLCSHPMWVDLRGTNNSIVPETVHHCVVKISPTSYESTGGKTVKTDAVHRMGKLESAVPWETLSPEEADSERIKQLKPAIVLDLLERFSMEQVLIFCRTNLDCDLMESFFRHADGSGKMTDKFSCRVLASMRSMPERQKALKDFKDGDVRILIATDVAARGIDIQELPFVINMTLPDSPQTYVHRSGRVGRADRIGLAISLVSTVKERVWFCRSGKPPCPDTRDYDEGGASLNDGGILVGDFVLS